MEAAKKYEVELDELQSVRERAFEMVKDHKGQVTITEYDTSFTVMVLLRIPKNKVGK